VYMEIATISPITGILINFNKTPTTNSGDNTAALKVYRILFQHYITLFKT